MKAIHGSVHGLVQGVGFRYSTRRAARRLELRGWVRNLPTGSVEIWAQGTAESIRQFREFLAAGPPGAFVGSVEVVEVEPDPRLDGFEIRA